MHETIIAKLAASYKNASKFLDSVPLLLLLWLLHMLCEVQTYPRIRYRWKAT